MKIEFKKQYEILFKKANTDIAVSKLLIETKIENIDQEVILFHLQQASEKLMKCLLIINKIKFSKTHDIEKLVKLAQKNKIQLIYGIEELEYLTDFAVIGRYEIMGEDIEEIDNYFELVIKLKNFIKKEVLRNEVK